MKYSFEDHGSTMVIRMSGELTLDQCDGFRRSLYERLSDREIDVVADFEHLTLIDSAGLEMLLALNQDITERGGQFRIASPDETVRKILEATRLDRLFDVHGTLEMAARSLR